MSNKMRTQKFYIVQLFLFLFVGIAMVGCTKEEIQAGGQPNSGPFISASLEEDHPGLDMVCQTLDTAFLMSEDGSLNINRCFGPLGQIPCPTITQKWGFMIVQEGYVGNEGVLNLEVALAPGWYGQLATWKDLTSNEISFDLAGIPTISNDWSNLGINPLKNRFALSFKTKDLPLDPMEMVVRVKAVKINLYGVVNGLSTTNLWVKNPYSDNPTSPQFSPKSAVITKVQAMKCNETPIPLVVEEVCKSIRIGASALNGCLTLSPEINGISGNISYEWSNGQTSPSITVCPNTTTNYSVIVSSNGQPISQTDFTVNVEDISCGNGNSGAHKVKLCHIPPGNPSNPRELCIDWNGVPAHDADYRPAGSTQGHDSGCHIGACGAGPCQE